MEPRSKNHDMKEVRKRLYKLCFRLLRQWRKELMLAGVVGFLFMVIIFATRSPEVTFESETTAESAAPIAHPKYLPTPAAWTRLVLLVTLIALGGLGIVAYFASWVMKQGEGTAGFLRQQYGLIFRLAIVTDVVLFCFYL